MLLKVLSIMVRKLLLKNIPNSGVERKKHTLVKTKMAKINSIFMNTTAIPVVTAHTFIAHIRDTPWPGVDIQLDIIIEMSPRKCSTGVSYRRFDILPIQPRYHLGLIS